MARYTRITENEIEYTNVIGMTIKNAFKGKDDKGYDRFEINFENGMQLIIEEKSQTGEFSAWMEG